MQAPNNKIKANNNQTTKIVTQANY